MQLCHPTIAAPAGFGFQLPTLHAEIPNHAVILSTDVPDTDLIRTLMDIDVIDPTELRDSISTAPEILADGLTAWLNHHVGSLERLTFGCGLVAARKANAFILSRRDAAIQIGEDENDLTADIPRYTSPVFYLEQCGTEHFFTFDIAANVLEDHHPGLFAAVIAEINRCALGTLPIRTPEELLNEFCFNWYDGYDMWEATDPKKLKYIKEALKNRLEGTSIKGHLPETVRADFGFSYWHQPGKTEQYTSPVLKNIARTTKNRLVKSVCKALVALREKRVIAEKKKAYLPKLPAIEYIDPVFSACCLIYQQTDHVQATLDDFLERRVNDEDTNTTYFGLEELPKNPQKLKSFFNRLETAFAVLQHMDSLITLITPLPDEGVKK